MFHTVESFYCYVLCVCSFSLIYTILCVWTPQWFAMSVFKEKKNIQKQNTKNVRALLFEF